YPRVLSQNECFRGYPETSLFLILPHFAVAVEQFVETVAIACFAALIAAFVGQLGVQELLRLSQSRNPVQSQQGCLSFALPCRFSAYAQHQGGAAMLVLVALQTLEWFAYKAQWPAVNILLAQRLVYTAQSLCGSRSHAYVFLLAHLGAARTTFLRCLFSTMTGLEQCDHLWHYRRAFLVLSDSLPLARCFLPSFRWSFFRPPERLQRRWPQSR